MATAIAAGVDPARAAEVLSTCEPSLGRMSCHETPNGVTFIRDDWKPSFWTVPVCVEFMKTAAAPRKIFVIGTVSDTPKKFRDRYKAIIRQTRDVADITVFVGEHAQLALTLRPANDRVMAFKRLYEANAFLKDYLQPGDLVLLKGSGLIDHLHRIIFSQTDEIACWREKCNKRRFCDDCTHRMDPSVPTEEVCIS